MFKALGSVFSKLGKSVAFKGTLAAVGTAVAGVVGARLSGVAAERGLPPEQAARVGQPVGQAEMFFAQVPWGPILLILAVGVGGYLITQKGK